MKTNEIKTIAKALLIIAVIVTTLLTTSCGTMKNCCGNNAKPTINKYVAKHNNFTKKHYSF